MDKSSLKLKNALIELTLSLYNNPVIPRKIVQFFIDSFISFIYNILFPIFIEKIKLVQSIDQKTLDHINAAINSTKQVFDKFSTEHKRFNVYKENDLMRDPEKNIFKIDTDKIYAAHYIPLQWTLTKLFETSGVLKLVEENIQLINQEKDTVSHFMQRARKSENFRRKICFAHIFI